MKKKVQMKLVAYFGIENNLLKVCNLGQEIPPKIQGCTRLPTEGNHIFSHYTHQKLILSAHFKFYCAYFHIH